MQDVLGKVSPYLETLRGWLDVPSNWLSSALDLDPARASWIVYGIVAWILAKWIFNMLFVDTQGRMDKFLILAAAVFFVLKFLGA